MGYVLEVHVPSRQVFRISTPATVAQVVRKYTITQYCNPSFVDVFCCFGLRVQGFWFRIEGPGLRA